MTSVTGADGAPSPLPTRAIMNYGATIATRRALPFGMSERAHKTLAHTPDTAKKKIKNVLAIGDLYLLIFAAHSAFNDRYTFSSPSERKTIFEAYWIFIQ